MTYMSDVRYMAGGGERGCGDLYLPDRPADAPAALVIHGGGWQALNNRSLAGVSELLVRAGFGVFAPNYRLIDAAPWPACGDDCLRAAHFLADAGRSAMRPLNRRQLLLVGASAGGHLALMTGLRLPGSMVAGIVSIAGPSDLRGDLSRGAQDKFPPAFWQRFFGATEVSPHMRAEASPVSHVPPHPPPLLCMHSLNDDLVPLVHSERIVEACRQQGGQTTLFTFEGAGHAHGIWRDEAEQPRRLLPELEAALLDFTRTL